MIQQIVTSEQQLIKLVKADMKKSAKEKGFEPTLTEIREQVEAFMKTEQPKEYPVYAFIDLTFLIRGFQVDLLTTTHYLNQSQLEKYLSEILTIELTK
jgi:glutamate-1-semialdehyde aminotransferase